MTKKTKKSPIVEDYDFDSDMDEDEPKKIKIWPDGRVKIFQEKSGKRLVFWVISFLLHNVRDQLIFRRASEEKFFAIPKCVDK